MGLDVWVFMVVLSCLELDCPQSTLGNALGVCICEALATRHGTQVTSDCSVSETSNASIPASALQNSSVDLIIVGIALAGVPVLLLITMIIVHLTLRCRATQKGEKHAEQSASKSVTVNVAGTQNASSNSAV